MVYLNGRFLTQGITGVQRFAYEIGSRLSYHFETDLTVLSPDSPLESSYEFPYQLTKIGKLGGQFWEQVVLPLHISKSDLLLNLTSTAPLYHNRNILTLHDVNFKRFPESFSKQFLRFYEFIIPRLLKKSLHIITVSEFSKSEIIRYYDVNPDKISVIYNASSFKSVPSIKDVSSSYCEYIFALSSINRNKNFEGLIEAFLKINSRDIHLYIAGCLDSKSFSQSDLVNRVRDHPRIKFLGRLSDYELKVYYQNALAFIFPSFFEGFGIPPLEVQSVGTPTIVSNSGALPEIYRDSVLYCDPYNIESIKNSIEQLLNDSLLRQQLIQKGLTNVNRFNWDTSASQVFEIAQNFK